MARNADSKYQGTRTTDLLKLKEYIDDEFECIRLDEGRGKLAGHCGAFVCKTKDGLEFKAKMVGPLPKLKEAFQNPNKWIGKTLTVRFQNWTKKGVPNHARTLQPKEHL